MTNNELFKKLHQLKNLETAGKPQDTWVASSKEILMSQIKPQATETFSTGDGHYYWQYFASVFKVTLRPIGAFALVLFTMLTYSATISVANASLPGDMLYPIKTAGEKVQLAFTFEDDKKVELQMNFVSRRVDELQQLVIKNDNPQEKVKKVSDAAKQISSDVKEVKESLNKISETKSVDAAKTVDTKTLEAGQTLIQAAEKLPKEVKDGVSKDMHEAIKSTEETGTTALAVIVKKYEKGDSAISGTEVASRVAERIKNTEDNIAGAATEVHQLMTDVASSTGVMVARTGSSDQSTTTLDSIAAKPEKAQAIIEQAKDLLDKKDFSSAVNKILESKDVVANTVSTVQAISATVQNKTDVVIPVSTSTEVIIKTLSPVQQGTTTDKISETTKSIIK